MGSVEQCGLVAGVSVQQYEQGSIKRHELTLKKKEDDRTKLTGMYGVAYLQSGYSMFVKMILTLEILLLLLLYILDIQDANIGPVFLTYRSEDSIEKLLSQTMKQTSPEYDFTIHDYELPVRHR
jgi:uncharacterized protein (DUF1015 family)